MPVVTGGVRVVEPTSILTAVGLPSRTHTGPVNRSTWPATSVVSWTTGPVELPDRTSTQHLPEADKVIRAASESWYTETPLLAETSFTSTT